MSITSKNDVCNLALDLLDAGTVQDIDNPTNATEELLARWYDHARRLCLRQHPWNFAAKRASLAASSIIPDFGYTIAYPVPADFIRVLSINDNDYFYNNFPTDHYGFEDNSILVGDGIYSSGDVLRLLYVSDFTNVARMDPMFIDLLAHEIALLIAYKATSQNSNVERVSSLADKRKGIAIAIDGQERPPKRIQRSRILTSRRTSHRSDRIIF